MGIRIHKTIGYGLQDVIATDRYEFKDPRFKSDLWEEISERIHEMTCKEAGALLSANEENFLALHSTLVSGDRARLDAKLHLILLCKDLEKEKDTVGSVTTFEPEMGLSNVLLFKPLMIFRDWSHRDDDIDYIEARIRNDYEPKIVEIPFPPYPYERWVYKDGSGFADRELVDNRPRLCQPYLPVAVLASLFLWKDFFVDIEAIAKQLRPMLYTYWS